RDELGPGLVLGPAARTVRVQAKVVRKEASDPSGRLLADHLGLHSYGPGGRADDKSQSELVPSVNSVGSFHQNSALANIHTLGLELSRATSARDLCAVGKPGVAPPFLQHRPPHH